MLLSLMMSLDALTTQLRQEKPRSVDFSEKLNIPVHLIIHKSGARHRLSGWRRAWRAHTRVHAQSTMVNREFTSQRLLETFR